MVKRGDGQNPLQSPKSGSLLQGKGEAMDLGILASETILETEIALCRNALMWRGVVLVL